MSAESSNVRSKETDRRIAIPLMVVAVFFYWIALYLYAPTLPTYVETKTDRLAMVGVVVSMYGLWQALVRLPLGVVSDWLGRRKPFIVVGFALAGLGAWLMGVADGVGALAVGRAITGLAAGTWVPLVVLFSSLFPSEESVRASAMLTMVGSVGRVLATAVTGSLNEVGGYSLPFFLAAGAAGVAIMVLLPHREAALSPKKPSLPGIMAVVTRRDVLLPSVLSMIAQYANWAATFTFVPILAKQMGASGVMLSVLLSLNIGLITVGNLLATAISNRLGGQKLVYVGFGLLTIGILIVAAAPSLAVLFVGQLCIGLSQGVAYPVLMGLSIRDVAEESRTTAMGLHQSVYAIGMFAGPALSGVIADATGIRFMFFITALVCLLVGVLVARQLD